MYQLKLHKSVLKLLQKHPDLKERCLPVFRRLVDNPFSPDLDIKAFADKRGHYRLRIGQWLFLYELQKEELLIWMWKADVRS